MKETCSLIGKKLQKGVRLERSNRKSHLDLSLACIVPSFYTMFVVCTIYLRQRGARTNSTRLCAHVGVRVSPLARLRYIKIHVNVGADYTKKKTSNTRYECTRCVSEITITIANLQLNVTLSEARFCLFFSDGIEGILELLPS